MTRLSRYSIINKFLQQTSFFIIVIVVISLCIAGFNALIIQQDNILRKYFILNPQARIKAFSTSLSDSLSKYFVKENKAASLEQVVKYIKRYGKTSLFEMAFVFKDKDGSMKQVTKSATMPVTKEILASERIYPVSIDNGRIDGYLVVTIRETDDAEFKEGLQQYKTVSTVLWLLYLFLILALSAVVLYHNYSAKIKLARDIAEIRASNDGLTGLHTHEHFMQVLDIEVGKYKIYGTPIALLMLDIDYFKQFNDKFGHPAGDRVLQEVARIIRSNTRATDVLARYGGEEFAVIVPYVGKLDKKRNKKELRHFVSEIKSVAERIRKSVEHCQVGVSGAILNVTISVGVAFYYHKAGTVTSIALLQKADKALYVAKRLGRNRIYIDYESAAA